MSPSPVFELDGVTVGAGDEGPRLDDVSLTVPCRGVTLLVGPSGSGKSSMLRLLNRLDVPDRGEVRYRGRPLDELDPCELRRRVAMVFQRPPLFPGTVLDNLRVARPDLDEAGARRALDRVGLDPELLARPAGVLSGGEAQRLAFARALSTDPEVVLADEPTSGLDTAPRRGLEALARDLADRDVPVVWVTHDHDQLCLADHVVVLAAGRVLAAGTLDELRAHPDAVVRDAVGAGDGTDR